MGHFKGIEIEFINIYFSYTSSKEDRIMAETNINQDPAPPYPHPQCDNKNRAYGNFFIF